MKKKIIPLFLILIISCTDVTSSSNISTSTSLTTTTVPAEQQLLIKNLKDAKLGVVRIVVDSIEIDPAEDGKLAKTQSSSSGSGFFISTDGYIVTNHHVIAGGVAITVYIGEERNSYKAQVVGTSECDDIAILKIDLPKGGAFYFDFAKTSPILGEEILSVGYPDGNEEITYLDGIISKEKSNGSNRYSSIDYAFEHTAEILPGSSGGPIVNKDGEVVGIAYMIKPIDSQGQVIGVQEFGIPSVVVENTISKILNKDFIKSFGIDGEQILGFGLYILSVEPNSPFDKAGFDGGELITSINGFNITQKDTMEFYCSAIAARDSNTPIKFKGIDIEENSEFEASVSLDGSTIGFELIGNITTTTKAKNNTTKSSTTTTKASSLSKPYFSNEALSLYIDSKQNQTQREYHKWRKSLVTVGIVGSPEENDVSTLKSITLEISRLLDSVNFEVIEGEGDITYYFLPTNEWPSENKACDEPDTKYYDSRISWRGNAITSGATCFKIGEEYNNQFTNEQWKKECRINHLKGNFLFLVDGSWQSGDYQVYGENNFYSRRYCNSFNKISDLDKQVLLIHYSPYVTNAETVDEVYNLLK